MNDTRHIAIAICTEIQSARNEIRLIPSGSFRANDGRPNDVESWRLTVDDAARLVERIRQRQTDILIDYEHQSINSEFNGQPAIAAGWFSSVVWRDDGLWATDVRWTARAQQMIEAGEYRYLSPVFSYSPHDGAILDLHSVALTNTPALEGLDDLLHRAAARYQKEQKMPRKPDAPDKATPTDQLAPIRAALKLSDDADAQACAQAINKISTKEPPTTASSDPARFAPVEVVEELKAEIATLRADHTQRDVTALVTTALSDGRLLPAQEQWAKGLGQQNIKALQDYLEKTPPLTALTQTQTSAIPPTDGTTSLTDEQRAICRAMGVSKDNYMKQLKEAGHARTDK